MSSLFIFVLAWLGAPPSFAEDDFALWLARVAANEGALWDTHEIDLVWQVVETNGRSDLPAFLRRHSPRVHGDKPCKAGNCLWTPLLDREGTWHPEMNCPEDWWNERVLPQWLEIVARADYLVDGGEYDPPCNRPPRTWGGPMDEEGALLRDPPLYRMYCDTKLNDGYAPFWVADDLPGGFSP